MQDNPLHILIVDSEQKTIRTLLGVFARKGIRGTVTENMKEAMDFLDKNKVDLVFLSENVESQIKTLRSIHEIKLICPELPVIAMAGADSSVPDTMKRFVDLAVKSIHAGCRNVLVKPITGQDIEELLDNTFFNSIVSVIDHRQGSRMDNVIVGRSSKLSQTISLAKKIATTSMPVLVSGESGTGKELISSLVHHSSQRAEGPYMQINCAALNDSLLESELFGHEKGAFTGAHAQRKGRFEMAHGGTLLLDEITETPLKFQATLLRVLEQQDFERVGGSDSVKVNVRIISTTNRDLLEEVAHGRFRQDLYYRLCGIRLIVPPLRERLEDLPDLIWYFVNRYSQQASRRITKLSDEMLELFNKYEWPGNIRQLRNVVRTSLALGTGSTLSLADASWLFAEMQPRLQKELHSTEDVSVSNLSGIPLVEVERQAILDTLEHTSGNQTKAAKILGISDRTLRTKMRQYRQQNELQPV